MLSRFPIMSLAFALKKKKSVFILKERAAKREGERENPKKALCGQQELEAGLNPKNHDLSRSQKLFASQTEPPRAPLLLHFLQTSQRY